MSSRVFPSVAATGPRRRAPIAALAAALLAAASLVCPKAEAADAVELFAALAPKAMLPYKLEWGKASATGARGLTLTDVVLTAPATVQEPAPAPLRARRVAIEDIDFEGLGRGDAPAYLRLRIEDASGTAATPLPGHGILQILGPGPYHGNATLDYKVRDGDVLSIANATLELAGLARFHLAADLSGLARSGTRLKDTWLGSLTLRSGRLDYEDRSLLGRLVSATAQRRNLSEDVVIGQWGQFITLIALTEGEPALALSSVLLAFLKDYRAPKGPLRITFAPPSDANGAVPLGKAFGAGLVTTLGASATYAGRR